MAINMAAPTSHATLLFLNRFGALSSEETDGTREDSFVNRAEESIRRDSSAVLSLFEAGCQQGLAHWVIDNYVNDRRTSPCFQ
jgi:hypothetical protein